MAEAATKVAMEHGLKTVDVTVKGPGSGREANSFITSNRFRSDCNS